MRIQAAIAGGPSIASASALTHRRITQGEKVGVGHKPGSVVGNHSSGICVTTNL